MQIAKAMIGLMKLSDPCAFECTVPEISYFFCQSFNIQRSLKIRILFKKNMKITGDPVVGPKHVFDALCASL